MGGQVKLKVYNKGGDDAIRQYLALGRRLRAGCFWSFLCRTKLF